MPTFTAYTNSHTAMDTVRDLHQRGRAVRLHPDPEAARNDSRPGDPIVKVAFQLPPGATFVLYTWEDDQFIVHAQGPDFAAAYADAAKAGRADQHRALSTAVQVSGAHAGSTIVPVARYATALTSVPEGSQREAA
jgi:hypothetical protein